MTTPGHQPSESIPAGDPPTVENTIDQGQTQKIRRFGDLCDMDFRMESRAAINFDDYIKVLGTTNIRTCTLVDFITCIEYILPPGSLLFTGGRLDFDSANAYYFATVKPGIRHMYERGDFSILGL